ncbi:uncharacterized protein LOC122723946 [Manihot esculenta]|uniref:Uncharacterized protein n=1 Tax=Manihot esculenta TaxID=3983 RepID=A0ACB7HDV0_MANES|nr:uncharacterized protein LOC122723946 [Manihot esculenta]KAG8650944.1 hypothetical protein MANES_07G082254v8 [Manihot esculenta]
MRLKLRNLSRESRHELEKSYNPINLDYIFEEDDPLNPWLEERENPALDGEENPWLEEDESAPSQSQQVNAPTHGHNIGGSCDAEPEDSFILSSSSDDDDGGSGQGGRGEGCGAISSLQSHDDPSSYQRHSPSPAPAPTLQHTYHRSRGSGGSSDKGKGVAHGECFMDAYNYGYGTYGASESSMEATSTSDYGYRGNFQ